MDPDVALARLREALRDAQYCEDSAMQTNPAHRNLRARDTQSEPVLEFMEYFAALDGWLSKGGFLPKDWSKGR